MNRTVLLLTALACAVPVFSPSEARAAQIRTNAVWIPSAPKWVSRRKIEKTVERVEEFLEWSIRRVTVHFYSDAKAFGEVHGFGDSVTAVSLKRDNSIRIGPEVNAGNFETIFGHELVHMVIYQKYKDAVPDWLEEGMANHVSGRADADYRYLSGKPLPRVREMHHPFRSPDPRLFYQASTALMKMLAARCDIHDLLQMSLQKGLEKYLDGLCGIADVDAALAEWVKRKAR